MVGPAGQGRRQREALPTLCLCIAVVAINSTIVTPAIPSIQSAVGFSAASLVWVVNAWVAGFGGFQLLGGRLGDQYGRRRMLLPGVALFTGATLMCALSTSPVAIIASRFAQGVLGAMVWTIAFSFMANLFDDAKGRAKAMGLCTFVAASGGTLGWLLGGALTTAYGWRAIFLVSVPLGAVAVLLGVRKLPRVARHSPSRRLDFAGAFAITAALLLALAAMVDVRSSARMSAEGLACMACAAGLFISFIAIERRAPNPLVPLRLFRIREVALSSVTGALMAAAALPWTYIVSLYLQRILQHSAYETGLILLPANVLTAVLSLAVAPKLVARMGALPPLVTGLICMVGALALLACMPLHSTLLWPVLPATALIGLGIGLAYAPLLTSAVSHVPAQDFGIASGLINTIYTMGGAMGLAVVGSLASARSESLVGHGADPQTALHGGYRLALWICAAIAATAVLVGLLSVLGWNREVGGAFRRVDG
jgi:EmrB/QacA subfamily drug resistance transporter